MTYELSGSNNQSVEITDGSRCLPPTSVKRRRVGREAGSAWGVGRWWWGCRGPDSDCPTW